MPRTPRAILSATLALLLAAGTTISATDRTSVAQTLGDANRDNRLEALPGEPYLVRDDLAAASAGRERRGRSVLVWTQLTDTHIVDEESPLRAEFVDRFGPPLTSAYRPQEGLSPQVLESMVSQLRGITSPVTGRRMALVMTTGDNSDNAQRNEVRWLIELLDGGQVVDPDSGLPGSCGVADDGTRYHGVRGGGEYYEPDASSPAPGGPDSIDGAGYSPDLEENQAEAGRSSQVRDYPGLFEEMNRPFESTGLGVPWYSIFGNHDALIQGNQPRNPALEAIATGCLKVQSLTALGAAAVEALLADGVTTSEAPALWSAIYGDLVAAAGDPDGAGAGVVRLVPADPERRPLKKAEYIAEHFDTLGTPVGHGFTAANVASGMGNYAFSPKPNLRFIVLDSINESGGADGNIDDLQFRWLHDQLLAADAQRQLAVVYAHHSLRTMIQPPASGFAPGDLGGDASPLVHFGGDPSLPCLVTDPDAVPTVDETLRCLLLRHPSAIAMVDGHEHENRVTPHQRLDANGTVTGGFWEITTASHIDWPQQSRLLEIVDNRDGTLSLYATLVEHAAPPVPEGRRLEPVSRLASISRELAYNDPDARNGEDGSADAAGRPEDRNVELLLDDPYAP